MYTKQIGCVVRLMMVLLCYYIYIAMQMYIHQCPWTMTLKILQYFKYSVIVYLECCSTTRPQQQRHPTSTHRRVLACSRAPSLSRLRRPAPWWTAAFFITMTRLTRRRWWLCAIVSGAAYHRPADTFGVVSFLPPSSLAAATCADLSVDSSGSCGRQHPFHRQYPPSSLPWPRRRCRRAIASLTVHESVVDTSSTTSNTLPIDIKSATFQELRAVSRLLVEVSPT